MESHIIQDYYGATYFIEQNKEREITIFIVDDNKVYLKLLKLALKRKNFTILTFTTGEECLDYLELEPDLVILDYHLDGINPYAQDGDKISDIILQKLPNTETIILSSDTKFKFVSDLNVTSRFMFKDEKSSNKINKTIASTINNIKRKKSNRKILMILIVFIALLISLVFKFG